MSNTVISTIKVTGDRSLEIKDLFQKSSVPTVLLCDAKNGDGITVEDDAIVIRCESRNSPPLPLVEKLSEEYPELTFDVIGKDLLNSYIQRWIFRSGQGQILDCIQGAYEGEGEEIVYMLDGEQLLKLPEWVAAEDHPDFDKASIESELSKWKSAKIDGILVEPKVAYAELKRKFDAEVDGIHEIVFGFENYSIVQRWKFMEGTWQLFDCIYEGEGKQIVFMQNGKQLNGLPEWAAADDQPDFLKLFGLWEKA